MRIMVQMIDTIGVDERGPPLHAMHDIIFRKEKFGEKCAVLTRAPVIKAIFFGVMISQSFGLSRRTNAAFLRPGSHRQMRRQ